MPRLNRAIELLEKDQPIYYTSPSELSYDGGIAASGTWADYLLVEMEHGTFDLTALDAFMKGLVAAGPTTDGYQTPPVIVTLPVGGTSESVMLANAWMVHQVFARGVHGILLCHARTPEAVRAFVEAARYPFQQTGVGDMIGVGQRGSGGQDSAAAVWGLSTDEYLRRADVWPLNPEGELMLGLKIEDRGIGKRGREPSYAWYCIRGMGPRRYGNVVWLSQPARSSVFSWNGGCQSDGSQGVQGQPRRLPEQRVS